MAMRDADFRNHEDLSSVMTKSEVSLIKTINYDDIAMNYPDDEFNILQKARLVNKVWQSKVGRMSTGTYRADDIHINHYNAYQPIDINIFHYVPSVQDSDGTHPIRLRGVNLMQDLNSHKHKTHLYEGQFELDGKTHEVIVARRGWPVHITFQFDQVFVPEKHQLVILLQFGDQPANPHTMIRAEVAKGVHKLHWSAGVVSVNDKFVLVSLHIPFDSIVGKARLTFDLITTDVNDAGVIMRLSLDDLLYVIFNPFCEEDEAYAKNDLINDFLIPDTGLLYVGTHDLIETVPWTFAQYNIEVLDTGFQLLDSSDLNYEMRSSPVAVVKTINSSICSVEDQGMIQSSWSGCYVHGVAPTLWQSTKSIVNEFRRKKKTVLYGQCYVFSALATSFFRSVGLLARSVTNFSSAHDNDGNSSLIVHWSNDGKPIDDLNPDSFWCFHSWCEVNLQVSGYQNSYKGWQAIDPTPQLTTYGMVCAGPCPVQAIKEGNIATPIDTHLFFARINNHQFHRIMGVAGAWRDGFQPFFSGKKIVTHNPSHPPINEAHICTLRNKDPILEILDITSNYKNPPGSLSLTKSIVKANFKSTHSRVFDDGTGDVTFAVCQRETSVGHMLNVNLRMTNQTAEERVVHATLTLSSVYYTGLTKHRIKTEMFIARLCPTQTRTLTMRVLGEDYCYYLTDFSCFKIYAYARVELTNQIFLTCEDFRVVSEPLEILTEKEYREFKLGYVVVQWKNALPISLTDCVWSIESSGLFESTNIINKNLDPMEDASLRHNFKPTKEGRYLIKVAFRSKEFTGARASTSINVKIQLRSDAPT